MESLEKRVFVKHIEESRHVLGRAYKRVGLPAALTFKGDSLPFGGITLYKRRKGNRTIVWAIYKKDIRTFIEFLDLTPLGEIGYRNVNSPNRSPIVSSRKVL